MRQSAAKMLLLICSEILPFGAKRMELIEPQVKTKPKFETKQQNVVYHLTKPF